MKTLHLVLKKRWFDMIASGLKLEEYRIIKPYWDVRLNKHYDVVRFRNGYKPDAPVMELELISIKQGMGKPEWGASNYMPVYIIRLGRLISIARWRAAA